MFIELHRDGKQILVNTMWIEIVSEEYGYIGFGGSNDSTSVDESYDEIAWKIAEGERVAAEG